MITGSETILATKTPRLRIWIIRNKNFISVIIWLVSLKKNEIILLSQLCIEKRNLTLYIGRLLTFFLKLYHPLKFFSFHAFQYSSERPETTVTFIDEVARICVFTIIPDWSFGNVFNLKVLTWFVRFWLIQF